MLYTHIRTSVSDCLTDDNQIRMYIPRYGMPNNWHNQARIPHLTTYYKNRKKVSYIVGHHHHLPPWIRSFDLFRQRHIAFVSWGVHGLFFLQVCSWGRVSEVWCCPFFQGGWSSFVCIWVSRLVFQRSLVLSLLILSSLVYPVTLLRKRISAALGESYCWFLLKTTEPPAYRPHHIEVSCDREIGKIVYQWERIWASVYSQLLRKT
jgi:hypothetical protein